MGYRTIIILGGLVMFGLPALVGVVLAKTVDIGAGIVGAVVALVIVVAIAYANLKKHMDKEE